MILNHHLFEWECETKSIITSFDETNKRVDRVGIVYGNDKRKCKILQLSVNKMVTQEFVQEPDHSELELISSFFPEEVKSTLLQYGDVFVGSITYK